MNNQYKKYGVAVIWLLAGCLCWLAGVYVFSYGTSPLVLPSTKFIMSTSPSLLTPLHFGLFHGTALILIFLFSTILSVICGKRRIWFVALMLWPVCFPMYSSIQDLIQYVHHYPKLPSWVVSWFSQAVLAYLFFTPLLGWAGMVVGNKLYRKRQAQQ